MKKRDFLLSAVVGAIGVVCPMKAFAGGAGGGATEATQWANHLELILQYEIMVEQYIRQGLQYATQLQNLIKNPASLLGSEIGEMINKIGAIMNKGQAIGMSLAEVNKKFGDTFKNPGAVSLANGFTKWHATSIDTLEAAIKSAGLQNEKLEDETAKIQALFDTSQAAEGNLSALQSLSAINSHMLKQMQSLGQLISVQNLAASTYMAEKTSQEKIRIDKDKEILDGFKKIKPASLTFEVKPSVNEDWNMYK